MPCRRPRAAILAHRWRSRRWPTCSTRATSSTTRPIRNGLIAIVSCSATATRPCCCTRRCTCQAMTISLDEIRNFRQWGSITPGHPEHFLTPGIETTTGPLGQGFANAVGMAAAEAHLAAVFNKEGHPIIDHHTWFICSDGDLMEGISHEAASFAGHFGLGKLIGFYDDNRITIDGNTDLTLSDDARAPVRGVWLARAARGRRQRPGRGGSGDRRGARRNHASRRLIIARTVIGYGSPNRAGTRQGARRSVRRRGGRALQGATRLDDDTSRSPYPTRPWRTGGAGTMRWPSPTMRGAARSSPTPRPIR